MTTIPLSIDLWLINQRWSYPTEVCTCATKLIRSSLAIWQFMRTLLGELGLEESTLTDVMSSVFQFEVKIAEIVAPNSERQNILQIYNKVTVSELQAMSPQFDWLSILRSLASPHAIDANDELLVYSIEYIKSLSTLIENSDPKVVHNFMLWHLAASFVQVTNSRMKEAYVKLYNTVTGARTGQEQWKDCANIVSNKFSMAVGALFVREAFGPEGKREVSEIVAHIKTAFKESIRYNGWMSEETRQVAIEKANAMDGKIGYPDYILDPEELDKEFEEVEVDQSNFLQSMVNQARFSLRKSIGKLSKPHDKDEWRAPPQIMNALYRPSTNSMVMLAAILQRPIFDSENLKALNYAGIGFVVAHELTHGFDTHGRLYNQDGNIAPWWSEESTRKFEERTRCVVDQYSEYEVEGTGMKINGNMTKAENIADLGAIKHAFNAYRTQVMESGEEEELPGLEKTNDQTFFLAYAQNWCTNRRTESSKLQLITDSHSPAAYRVIGTLSQFDEFSRAFSCNVGSNMNPEQKCSVF
ncbi:endothelin-converting enzyme 2-like [Ptychodera flava]|uniref:endothelin-converting enzyme 2-like n=1 Tax=Ptychodera flava TaxID=63121 RepID=UPI00396A6AE8